MELKSGELKIFYKTDNNKPIDKFFDKFIETALKAFGYRQWASGVEIKTGVRDIAFEKRPYIGDDKV